MFHTEASPKDHVHSSSSMSPSVSTPSAAACHCKIQALQSIMARNADAVSCAVRGSEVDFTTAISLLADSLRQIQGLLVSTASSSSSDEPFSRDESMRLHLRSHPISPTSACDTSSSSSSIVPSMDVPPNSFLAYRCLFELAICHVDDHVSDDNNDIYAIDDGDWVAGIGAVLLYNIGTLYSLLATTPAVLAVPSSSSHDAQGTAQRRMMQAMNLLCHAMDFLEQLDLSGEILDGPRLWAHRSTLPLLRLAILNNMAYLYSFFMRLDDMHQCLEQMHETLSAYRSTCMYESMTLSYIKNDGTEVWRTLEETEHHAAIMYESDFDIFDMNQFLLCKRESFPAAPAA
jgi:hypothetical protein